MEVHIIKQYYSVCTPCKTSNWVLLVILIVLFLNFWEIITDVWQIIMHSVKQLSSKKWKPAIHEMKSGLYGMSCTIIILH